MNARDFPAAATTSTTAPARSCAGRIAQITPSHVNVADAVMAPKPGGIVTPSAVAVELAVEPENALLVTSVKLPDCGVTRT